MKFFKHPIRILELFINSYDSYAQFETLIKVHFNGIINDDRTFLGNPAVYFYSIILLNMYLFLKIRQKKKKKQCVQKLKAEISI